MNWEAIYWVCEECEEGTCDHSENEYFETEEHAINSLMTRGGTGEVVLWDDEDNGNGYTIHIFPWAQKKAEVV